MRSFLICDDDACKVLFNNAALPKEVSNDGIDPAEGDVLFDLREESWDMPLYQKFNGPVFINAVIGTLAEHNAPVNIIRINGWPGMLEKQSIEAAAHPDIRVKAEEILRSLGKKIEWVADIPGMVSPRVIAMIVNEACLAEEERVSDKDSMDTAMKLGTNYPKGPFEWANQVGWERISGLLNKFASDRYSRYQPAERFKEI